jgi:hypothetical protein
MPGINENEIYRFVIMSNAEYYTDIDFVGNFDVILKITGSTDCREW